LLNLLIQRQMPWQAARAALPLAPLSAALWRSRLAAPPVRQ